MTTDPNFATCEKCSDEVAQTCAANASDSLTCYQDEYSLNSSGATDFCEISSGCEESLAFDNCLQCDAGDSEFCNVCDFGSYEDDRYECKSCL